MRYYRVWDQKHHDHDTKHPALPIRETMEVEASKARHFQAQMDCPGILALFVGDQPLEHARVPGIALV